MNRQSMIKQAQLLQKKLLEAQENLEELIVDATAGGGMVKASVNGKMKLTALTIDPEILNPEEVEILEEIITAAINEALQKAQDLAQEKMNAITGQMGLPGTF
jgi:DNA-binding YbaB/EbfC family protein